MIGERAAAASHLIPVLVVAAEVDRVVQVRPLAQLRVVMVVVVMVSKAVQVRCHRLDRSESRVAQDTAARLLVAAALGPIESAGRLSCGRRAIRVSLMRLQVRGRLQLKVVNDLVVLLGQRLLL